MEDQDEEKIGNLKQMKKDYEEKINSIEAAMRSGSGRRVNPGEINTLRTELFKMKNFGPNLRLILHQRFDYLFIISIIQEYFQPNRS